jgi:hypothetical protein
MSTKLNDLSWKLVLGLLGGFAVILATGFIWTGLAVATAWLPATSTLTDINGVASFGIACFLAGWLARDSSVKEHVVEAQLAPRSR